ncbi:MAG: hypothetical protein HC859_01660 [Bacteroidia bacterium]|nr:hypothetical protein [Bacteroidia bacterium]
MARIFLARGSVWLHFGNHYLYPGLINAHDHLEMNLYPRLGRPPYTNFTQWATDIRQPDESPVKEIEAIPIGDRLLWGGIKNLISGATVVVHHNPWQRQLGRHEFPVLVPKKIAWTHSLTYHNKVRKPWLSGSNIPFVMHAAEGTDDAAAREFFKHQPKFDFAVLVGN